MGQVMVWHGNVKHGSQGLLMHGRAWYGTVRCVEALSVTFRQSRHVVSRSGKALSVSAVKVMRVMSRLSGDWQGSQGASLRVRLVSVWLVSSRSGLPAMARSVEHCRVQ